MTAADRQIRLKPLTETAFAEFGDVLAAKAKPNQIINQGMCGRHHDLAKLAFAEGGKAGISLFDATPRALLCCQACITAVLSLVNHVMYQSINSI